MEPGQPCEERADTDGAVIAVSSSDTHGPPKRAAESIRLIAGFGVEGDAHFGETVQHLSRKRSHPDLPNLRQVHLIHAELHDELRAAGFELAPGQMGENITTRGLDLLASPVGTRIIFAGGATIELTGLRNPCAQLDQIQPGLMAATLGRAEDGGIVRKSGVMAVVVVGGIVRAGDRCHLELPTAPHRRLEPV